MKKYNIPESPCYSINPVTGERTIIKASPKPRKVPSNFGVWNDLCQTWEISPKHDKEFCIKYKKNAVNSSELFVLTVSQMVEMSE